VTYKDGLTKENKSPTTLQLGRWRRFCRLGVLAGHSQHADGSRAQFAGRVCNCEKI